MFLRKVSFFNCLFPKRTGKNEIAEAEILDARMQQLKNSCIKLVNNYSESALIAFRNEIVNWNQQEKEAISDWIKTFFDNIDNDAVQTLHGKHLQKIYEEIIIINTMRELTPTQKQPTKFRVR